MELEIRNVSKMYKNRTVLSNINLRLKPGVYGLVGPNGAGKSTLINIIATLLQANEGSIFANGESIRDISLYRSKIGFLPQALDYYNNFTGCDFINYMCLLKEHKSDNQEEYVDELLDMVNLFDVRNSLISTYSGGMKQRLGIAQTFIENPEILLLDEPTVGLDLNERKRFKEIIKKMGKKAIVILSTHIISDVEETADEIIFIDSGKIIATGTCEYFKNYMYEQGLDSLEDVFRKMCRGDTDDKI